MYELEFSYQLWKAALSKFGLWHEPASPISSRMVRFLCPYCSEEMQAIDAMPSVNRCPKCRKIFGYGVRELEHQGFDLEKIVQ